MLEQALQIVSLSNQHPLPNKAIYSQTIFCLIFLFARKKKLLLLISLRSCIVTLIKLPKSLTL